MRRLGAGAWAALAAAPVAVAVVIYGLRDHYRFGDEAIGIFGGRMLQADFFGQLFDPQFSSRPLERGLAVLWAGALEIAPTTTGAFQLFHVVMALIAVSAAIPVALLLRGLGARTAWAVAGGVIAIAGPWAIFGVTLLNNAPGMTTFAWLLLAAQRVVLVPGWRSDLLFCAAALLVGVIRAGNLPLVAGVAPAVLWGAWARGGSVAGFVREMVRRHWILLGLAAAAAMVLAVRGFDGLFGSYGAGRSTYLPWDILGSGIRNLGGHLAVATGVIAFGFAVPWVVRGVVRPAAAGMTAERAFALTAATVALIFVYVYAPALNEDRYFYVLTPLVVVAFVLALAVRPLGLGWLVAGAGVLAFFLARGTAWPDSPDALVQVPSAPWWNRVIEGRLSDYQPLDEDVVAVVLAAAVVLAGGWLLARGSVRARRLAPLVLVGGVLLHQGVSAGYVLHRWSVERGNPDVTFDEKTFVDRAVPDGGTAMLLRANPTGDVQLPFSWDDVAFWNQKLNGTLDHEPQPVCCLGGNSPIQWDEQGRVTSPILGDYAVTPLSSSFSLAGTTVLREPSQGYRVDRLADPVRMAFLVRSQVPGRLSLTVWPRNAPGRGTPCLVGGLVPGTRVRIDGKAGRVQDPGPRSRVPLSDAQGLDVDLLHPRDLAPVDLRLTRC